MGNRDVAVILADAIDQKRAEGGRYSLRELERASGVNYSHISRILSGQRHPSADVLQALARALAPYFPLDDALLAAGYIPEGESGRLHRLFGRLSLREKLAALDHAMHGALWEHTTEDEPEHERERQQDAEEQPDHPRAPAPCGG